MSCCNRAKKIAEGFALALVDGNAELSKQRMAICTQCPNFGFQIITVKLGVCRICGCVCSKKTRVVEEKCPIDKW
jgi:hypothetical protein